MNIAGSYEDIEFRPGMRQIPEALFNVKVTKNPEFHVIEISRAVSLTTAIADATISPKLPLIIDRKAFHLVIAVSAISPARRFLQRFSRL